jgi:phosphotransferase system HPr-like phosphotransfer protein
MVTLKGRLNMVKTIKLTQSQVQHFVNVASRCDFDIDICYNSYVVDAKSFLGVYGLDFSRPLKVEYNGYNREFEDLLNEFAVAC